MLMNIDNNTFTVDDPQGFKIKMLNWADRFNIFCLLDNNNYQADFNDLEFVLAAGCVRSFSFPEENAFGTLQQFFNGKPSLLFGHLSYNATGNTYTGKIKPDIDFGKGFFFEPETVVKLTGNIVTVELSAITPKEIFNRINEQPLATDKKYKPLPVQPFFTKEEYLQRIKKIKQHIQRGDCYELNFCQHFFCDHAEIDPVNIYQKLSSLSPAPFGALYKLNNNYCLCASPERFLKKAGTRLISQPIKGTKRRDLSDKNKDLLLANELRNDAKEQSENVMITDLVRNDLSMVCEKGSVKVTELFGVYTFPQVHHLVTTVEGTLAPGKCFTEALSTCFPMGSMTGAPKKRVTELIEKYEGYDRGLFSGAIGYITPEGDFDFNVVIRSIFYDNANRKLSFFAGGGITFYSDPEKEFDESNTKAEAIIKILSEI